MTQDTPGLRLRLVRETDGLTRGAPVWSTGVGPAGELLLLQRPLASHNLTTLWTVTAESVERRSLLALGDRRPYVQPMPVGDTLVAQQGHRGEHLATICRSDGSTSAPFALGYALADVQTSASGHIWVSYLDEGVLSGRESGLTCFDAEGNRRWDFDVHAPLPPIYDCYALNVDGETAWAYYYDSFTLLRIAADESTAHWMTGVSGASAIAVGERAVLLYGTYQMGPEAVCHVADFDTDQLVNLRRYSLLLPSGEPLSATDPLLVTGRGPVLHVVTQTHWYQLDVNAC